MSGEPPARPSVPYNCAILSDGSVVEDERWPLAGTEGDQPPPTGHWVCGIKQARPAAAARNRTAIALGVAVVAFLVSVQMGATAAFGGVIFGSMLVVAVVLFGFMADQRRKDRERASWLYLGDSFAQRSGSERLNALVQAGFRRAHIVPSQEYLFEPHALVDGGWGYGESSLIFNEPADREGRRRLQAQSHGEKDLEIQATLKGAILEELRAAP